MEKLKFKYRAYRYRYLIDAPEVRFMTRILKKGNIAVDIGSHKGGYLYWMQKYVGPEGRVYAFEPQKKLFNYLEQIIQLNQYMNVTIENKGLSAQSGTMYFHIPNTDSGSSPGARIEQTKSKKKGENLEIEVVTLDDYFYHQNIHPNLIKIDVEGHEAMVLKGGTNLLKDIRPTLIMECENRHLKQESIFDVFKILLDFGYKGYFFEGKKLKPVEHFKLDLHQKTGEGRFWEKSGYINNFVFQYNSSL